MPLDPPTVPPPDPRAAVSAGRPPRARRVRGVDVAPAWAGHRDPPRPSRRQVLRGAGAAAALVALAGCRSAVGEAAHGRTPGGPPRRGGTVHVGSTTDFTPSLLFTASGLGGLQRLVYNTLTEYDDRLRPQPSLARSWTLAPDGTAVTFRLREDVTFHTGRPFTADDVVFAVRNLQNPVRAAQLRTTAAAVARTTVHGPHEVTLEFAHPVSNLFDLVEFMVIPDRETFADALSGHNLVGTGPFRWKRWTPGAGVELERNDAYWVPGRPYLDAVRLQVIPQPDALLSSLRSGQTQLSYSVSGRDAATVREHPALRVSTYPIGAGGDYVGCNTAVRPFGDRRVRQAVAWAVDRERVVAQVLGGFAMPSAAPWPRSSPAFDEADRTWYRHDPDRARQLLRQAGVDGLEVDMAYPAQMQALAQLVQYDLRQVGIRTTLQPMDATGAQKRLISGSMPGLWVLQHAFAQVHPSTLAVSAYPFNEASNTSHFRSARYTDLVQRAWRDQAVDGAAVDATQAVYREISRLLLDEAFLVELAVVDCVEVSSSRLTGSSLNKFSFLNLDNAWLG